MNTLGSGELAKRAGVRIDTVRQYERKGLLRHERLSSGYRRYRDLELSRMRFIHDPVRGDEQHEHICKP